MLDVLLAAGVILLLLLGWTGVQQLARGYAARHPELGPAREEGSGCGSGCGCSTGHCDRRPPSTTDSDRRLHGECQHDPVK